MTSDPYGAGALLALDADADQEAHLLLAAVRERSKDRSGPAALREHAWAPRPAACTSAGSGQSGPISV
ncbi:hypothetical protein ACFWUZ_02730 [Streptomyces sp. NPDC058646]|uniref:hypothetical protein n=1 Tax=Streptomyces sp. NPDC058646 TaxID=3346574 RepID=UPI003664C60B